MPQILLQGRIQVCQKKPCLLRGWRSVTIWQHCYGKPHPVAGRPAICKNFDECAGHFVEKELTEVVEAGSEAEAIDNSMQVYENSDLEPTWCEGYPKIEVLKE